MKERSKIARAASIVGLSTLLSRLAGLARDQVTAYFFGSSFVADAFFMAFRIPNLLRRLLAEGALTVAFVPVFTETREKDGQTAAGELFRNMFGLLALVLTAVCALGLIFAPQIVAVMAPGFKGNPEQFQLTIFLTRVLFPYIFFMGLCAVFMGALNSAGRFAAPALGPFVCNLVMILAAAALSPRLQIPILGLAIGALAGGALQLAIQLPSLARAGLPLAPGANFRSPAIKKILLLMGPAALGAAVYQLSVFINSILASKLPEGSVSLLYYADRLMQFPLGIFTMAIGSAALPALARQSALGDRAGFIDSARFALGLSFFITIPAAVGLAVLAEPLVTFLFQRGSFSAQSALGTAAALRAFAPGLPFLSGAGILARIFYSRADTKTPAIAAAVCLMAGTLMAFILMHPFKHVGLALASSLASLMNFCWLAGLLLIREKDFPGLALLKETAVISLAALLMGAAANPLGRWAMGAADFRTLTLRTLTAVAAGVLVYALLAAAFKTPYLKPLVKRFRRNF
ncbi:MAG: murein biosynthesis integral membrane protein MurJ [Candidatus Adiutrix sp.]|jgi:putative peptidoglycan lipid II flippase|nr:murein biosynthesis integral membrane protein MurJ [Candidatus Adiutrix sp.]